MGYTQPGCRITGGQINFDGVELTKLTDSQKRKYWGNRMTYVAQSAAASFNPAHRLINQTTESTIRAGLKKQNEAFDEARALYDALNLPNASTIGERYPHQVSGGQLQRIMTAMAMSPNPDLIIFDEAALTDGRDAFNVALRPTLDKEQSKAIVKVETQP